MIQRLTTPQSTFGDMMYAPEQYYAVNGSVEYMRDQLNFEIRQEMPNLEFDMNNIYLLTDDTTARSAAAGAPRYRVLILDNDGVFHQRSGHFVPDVARQKENLRLESEQLAADIRAGGDIVKKRAQFDEKKKAYEDKGKDLEYKERKAQYEAREGRPRRSIPASELYSDADVGGVIADSAGVVADVAMEAIQLPAKARRSAADALTSVYEEAVEKRGKRARSKIIEDIERREAKD